MRHFRSWIVRWSILLAATAGTGCTSRPGAPVAVEANAPLPYPYSKLADLSEAQRAELLAVHADVERKVASLRADERARSLATLTDAQRREVDQVLASGPTERDALRREWEAQAEEQVQHRRERATAAKLSR